MARIYKRFCYADTRGELVEYKDAKRGASEDAFWDDDELVDYRAKKKKKRKRVPGCPGNDGKSHVYVWVDYNTYHGYTRFHSYYRVFQNWEIRVCCGCNKRAPRKSGRARRV